MTRSRHIHRPRHRWDETELTILREWYPHVPARLIAQALDLPLSGVHRKAHKLGLEKSAAFLASDMAARIRRGKQSPGMVAAQFPKGHVPANKGLRRPGWGPGRMKETQFKPGRPAHEAHNYVPIGTERISKDGFLERKVTDDPSLCPARRWVAVHRLVWEAAHGPIPRGHIVAFKRHPRPTSAEAITPDILECISLAENMHRNSYHNYPQPIPQLIKLRAAVVRKINRRVRDEKQG